jgi:hypothetical protein
LPKNKDPIIEEANNQTVGERLQIANRKGKVADQAY